MSSITFLTSQNFVVLGTRQKSLGINVRGNVFVFFKMHDCDNCAQFEPVFVQLSKQEGRVTCAILDVTQNRDVVMWSRATSTPITAVPVLILYIDGRPHAKFNGTKNIPSIQGFITKALQSSGGAATHQQFMPHQQQNMYGVGTGVGMGNGYPAQGIPKGVPGGKSYMPEIGSAPSMKGVIKGYVTGNNVEEDEDTRLIVPDTVIPHNTPWEAESRDEQ